RGDIRRANAILHPYTLDVKQVAWHSVYEVGHRGGRRSPRAPDADRGDIRRANAILHPYTLDVKQVAWHSVYEVGHR
ncbi:phenol 2-monooxygenase, partial [Methylobacterium radiotolerans]